MAKEIVAMILAGGRGSRLYALTQKTAKPAVGFGGKYRIVDFPLSNCVNSNIDTVGIATQYQPQKLNEYIGNGQPWDLDRLYGGVHTLPPYEQAKGTDWYKGTANAIYQNISFIDSYDPEYVIILSGDQICKQDYADFLRFHKEKGAEFSVAVMEVDWKEASRFGLMVADKTDRITEFQEKPPVPKSNLASMGIYIFNWDVLKKYLIEDEADPNSKNDFGMNIIPPCCATAARCTPTALPATGVTWARSTACGKPTWKCWIPKIRHRYLRREVEDLQPQPGPASAEDRPPRCGAGFPRHRGLQDLRQCASLCAERRRCCGRGRYR